MIRVKTRTRAKLRPKPMRWPRAVTLLLVGYTLAASVLWAVEPGHQRSGYTATAGWGVQAVPLGNSWDKPLIPKEEILAMADSIDPRLRTTYSDLMQRLQPLSEAEDRRKYLVTLAAKLPGSTSVPLDGEERDGTGELLRHDLPDKVNRPVVAPTSHITAFNCSSNRTVYQSLSLTEPRVCRETEAMYREGINVTLQVMARARLLPVQMQSCKLQLTETVTRCGFNSLTYGTRVIQADRPIHLTYDACRAALRNGRLNYDGQEFIIPSNHTTVNRKWFAFGYLDSNHYCSTASFTRRVKGKQVLFTNSYLQVSAKLKVSTIKGKFNPHTNRVVWANGISAHYQDKAAYDEYEGSMVWENIPSSCASDLSNLYQGRATLRKHKNNHQRFIEVDDLIIVREPEKELYAAFAVEGRSQSCGRVMIRTQISSVMIQDLTDGASPIELDKLHVHDLNDIQTQSNQAFHHFSTHLNREASDAQLRAYICQAERKSMAAFLAMAADDNPYALYSEYGEGFSLNRAGSVLHVGQCPDVVAQLRQADNCSQEIPVMVDGMETFVDPITRNIVDIPTPVPCDPLNPVTYKVDGHWVCASPHLHHCKRPLELAPSSNEYEPNLFYYHEGHGKGISTQQNLQAHLDFLHESMARRPATSNLAVLYQDWYDTRHNDLNGLPPDSDIHRGLSPFLTQDIMEKVTEQIGSRFFIFFRMFGDHGTRLVSVFVVFVLVWTFICAIRRMIRAYRQTGLGFGMIEAFLTTSGKMLSVPLIPFTAIHEIFMNDAELRQKYKRHRANHVRAKNLFNLQSWKDYHRHLDEMSDPDDDDAPGGGGFATMNGGLVVGRPNGVPNHQANVDRAGPSGLQPFAPPLSQEDEGEELLGNAKGLQQRACGIPATPAPADGPYAHGINEVHELTRQGQCHSTPQSRAVNQGSGRPGQAAGLAPPPPYKDHSGTSGSTTVAQGGPDFTEEERAEHRRSGGSFSMFANPGTQRGPSPDMY